ncbi:MAG: hypothetical protein AVDCRST_MAG08-2612, partial [uncultured Acetobacteraceae bacterium]
DGDRRQAGRHGGSAARLLDALDRTRRRRL